MDFNNRLGGANKYNLLIDSNETGANILNRPLTQKEKAHNEKLINSLIDDWSFLEKNAKVALTNGKFDEFKTSPSEEIIEKYFNNLAHLHYYYARNRRKNKIT